MSARSALTVVSGTTITSAWGNLIRDHIVSRTTSDDMTAEGQLNVNTTNDTVDFYTGSAVREIARYSAAATFTPTWAQGATLTGGTYTVTRAIYSRRGRWITGECVLTCTNSMNGGSGAGNGITVPNNLPTPASGSGLAAGSFDYLDSGTAHYIGAATMSGSTFVFLVHNAGAALGGAPSFAIASGDILSFCFAYEAAS